MNTPDLVFIGIRGSVLALDRGTGRQAWATRLKGLDFVNLVIEDGTLLATCSGEVFCLDAFAGKVLWHNPLKGYGRGLAAIATASNPGSPSAQALAATRRAEEAAAAAAT